MTIQPDPNRHEASRAAFEADYHESVTSQFANGKYVEDRLNGTWWSWCRALDWRDSQVCEWKWNAKWDWWESGCVDQRGSEESPRFPFCPGCGRRVKIQAKNADLRQDADSAASNAK